jgi:hypothetical protein
LDQVTRHGVPTSLGDAQDFSLPLASLIDLVNFEPSEALRLAHHRQQNKQN